MRDLLSSMLNWPSFRWIKRWLEWAAMGYPPATMNQEQINAHLLEVTAHLFESGCKSAARELPELNGVTITAGFPVAGVAAPTLRVRVEWRWPDDAPLKAATFDRSVDRLASWLDCDYSNVDERKLADQMTDAAHPSHLVAEIPLHQQLAKDIIHHLRLSEQGLAFVDDLMKKAAAIRIAPENRQHAAELGAELELDHTGQAGA